MDSEFQFQRRPRGWRPGVAIGTFAVMALASNAGPSVAAAAPAALTSAAPAASLPSTSADGLALGRAVGRALVSFQSPDMCAIPLLVARCRADFDAFVGRDESAFDKVPGLGDFPLAHMRTYYATGNPAQWPAGFSTIRTATAPDALWAARPLVAWAMDEGIVEETVDASMHSESAIYAAPAASQMLRRVKDGGAEASLFGGDFATADGHFQANALDRFARAVDEHHPVAAVPQVPFPGGERGDVYLGIGYATVFQMCDAPAVAALPESQAFLDDFFLAASRGSSVRDASRRLGAIRDELRFTHGYDRAKVTASLGALIAYQNQLTGATLRRTLVGQFASQIAYNATVQRDPGFVSVVVRHVSQWNDADAAFPGLARRRVALGLLDTKDFDGQRRAAMALLGFLLIDVHSK